VIIINEHKMFAKFLCRELIYNWLEVNGLQDVISMHVSETQFERCCPIVLRRSLFVSFCLERSSIQFVTIMHIKNLRVQLQHWEHRLHFVRNNFSVRSHNCHQKPCNA